MVETVIVFHYLFVNEPDVSERQLRYEKWQLSDLLLRRSLRKYIVNKSVDTTSESDEKSIEILESRIRSNPKFLARRNKQQKAILENFPEWRIPEIETGNYSS